MFLETGACILLLFIQLSQQNEGHCSVSNLHVTQEDGSEATVIIKPIRTASSCDKNGDKSEQSLPFEASRLRSPLPVILDIGTLLNIKTDSFLLPACQDESMEQCIKRFDDSILQRYADYLSEKELIPLPSGETDIDRRLAQGLVLAHVEKYDEAIKQYTKIIQMDNEIAGAYYGRGLVYVRKGLQVAEYKEKALNDFSKVIEFAGDMTEGYERKAEVLIQVGHPLAALEELSVAMRMHRKCPRLLYLRATANLVIQNLTQAESDFRAALNLNIQPSLSALYHLGITLFNRGKVRNAIQVFKDALQADSKNTDLLLGLGHAYKEIGNYRQSEAKFSEVLSVNGSKNKMAAWQYRGILNLNYGNVQEGNQYFGECMKEDKFNHVCQYYQGVSHLVQGQYFNSIKTFTKVIVYNTNSIKKLSPEFLKSHYLREYARYLHTKLDSPISSLVLEEDFSGEFLDHWVKKLPYESLEKYKEQPGIQPHITDVYKITFERLPKNTHKLLCKALKLGRLAQVKVDGFLPNERLKLATGLAAIHIAQYVTQMWSRPKAGRLSGKKVTWFTVFNLAVQYRRLVEPETWAIWLDKIKYGPSPQQYKTDITFISGHVANIQRMQYFDLVFKLFKSMLIEYRDSKEVDKVKTAEELIKVAKGQSKSGNLFMSTQVPSTRDKSQQYDGIVMSLTAQQNNMILLALSIATIKSRTNDFYTELDYVFTKMHDEVKKQGLTKITDAESLVNLILYLAYYFYNLMPISKGTSAVAYSVIMGLLLAIGRDITGGIPNGKLMDMEAMLSGTPDAFILVTKQWMNIKKSTEPLSTLGKVSDVLPTIRSVIEVLNLNNIKC